MSPRLAGAGLVAELVQFVTDLRVGHALPPQFDGLRHHVGVQGRKRLRDQILPGFLALGVVKWVERRSIPNGDGDRKHVSFMYSYPNYIPLPASAIERIVKAVGPFEYDRIYGAFWDTVIDPDGKAVVKESAERYLRAIA